MAVRCFKRLMFAKREWEMPADYPTPCLFTTGGIVMGEELIMSYGAADQKVGISWANAVAPGKTKERYASSRVELPTVSAGVRTACR
jgi:hypothetical protein